MVSIKYNKTEDAIIASYEDNFGRVREEDVTKQVLDAAFESFLSKGLASIAEYCEYEVNGTKFKVSVVKNKKISAVKRGKWITNSDRPDTLICSVCDSGFDMWFYEPEDLPFCPKCEADMRGESND